MKLTRPICYLDIESTGTDPVEDQIIEMAIAMKAPDGKKRRWVQGFKPTVPIKPGATEKHGRTDADVANNPPFSQFAQQVVDVLAGKDLCGYNLWRLDLPMLDEELRRCGLKLDLEGVEVIDCFGIFAKKEARTLSDAVRKYTGKDHDGAHGAWADAVVLDAVLAGQLEAYPDLADLSIEKLAEYSRVGDVVYADLAGKLYYDADGDMCFSFGKSKGRKVADDVDYARWMLSRNFPGSTRDALAKELRRLEEDGIDT